VAASTESFAEMLDAALAEPAVDGRLIETPDHTFLYVRPDTTRPRARVLATARVSGPQPAPAALRPPSRRRGSAARELTGEQQRALAGLIALGARLDADFTPRELQSAFRSLARRYHPDRHPGSTDAERTTLSQQFAAVLDHYRRLCAIAPRERHEGPASAGPAEAG